MMKVLITLNQVTKNKINNHGDCHLDMGFEIPFELMNDVMSLIIEWKSKVQIVPDEYDAYKENLKKIDFPVIKPKKNKL